MLYVRAEQMEKMALEKQRLFPEQMISHLNETYPKRIEKQELDDAKLKAFVEESIARARTWGIESTSGIKEYLDCRLIFGFGFDLEDGCPWAAELLSNMELSGQEKAEGLAWHLVFDKDWAENPDG